VIVLPVSLSVLTKICMIDDGRGWVLRNSLAITNSTREAPAAASAQVAGWLASIQVVEQGGDGRLEQESDQGTDK
jgi:hypothetical protein